MCKLIKETKPKARKNHFCDGREQLITHSSIDNELLENQIDNCKGIKKGDQYINQFVAESAHEAYMWKSCLGCYKVIADCNVFDES